MFMNVKVRFTGLIRHYARETEKIYELPDASKVSDLLLVVGREYGPRMPASMWDAGAERFHSTIVATRKGSPLLAEDETLRADDEIYILSRMAGG
jgi:molybdopterin converting factor small subunit